MAGRGTRGHIIDGKTKKEWVLAQPHGELSGSVAARGAALGYHLTLNHVNQLRSIGRKEGVLPKRKPGERNRQTPRNFGQGTQPELPLEAPKKGGRPKGSKNTVRRQTGSPEMPRTDAEQDFVDAAMAIGIQRAAELVTVLQMQWAQLRNQLTGR